MYDRVNDDEELKNNISDFFDILYSILDTDKDDKISHEELRPLLFVMYYTKMTEVHFLKEDPPYLEFTKSVLVPLTGNVLRSSHQLTSVVTSRLTGETESPI